MEANREALYKKVMGELCNLEESSLQDMLRYISALKSAQKKKDATIVYIQTHEQMIDRSKDQRKKRKRIVKDTPNTEIVITTISGEGASMDDLRLFAQKYLG